MRVHEGIGAVPPEEEGDAAVLDEDSLVHDHVHRRVEGLWDDSVQGEGPRATLVGDVGGLSVLIVDAEEGEEAADLTVDQEVGPIIQDPRCHEAEVVPGAGAGAGHGQGHTAAHGLDHAAGPIVGDPTLVRAQDRGRDHIHSQQVLVEVGGEARQEDGEQ